MDKEKFQSEAETLKRFFETYCAANAHEKRRLQTFTCKHNDLTYVVESDLCSECKKLLDYSLIRLEECPHEIKPRCRKCPDPCYEKDEWKKLAKVMRYSGLRLGILKVKEKVKSVFKKEVV
ncbi:nitrous oxide-stimulated promoter family protein [Sulfurimonas sp. HSL3-2]|uniref:nitrous oxide-stimulated promoter family protein n=1 Tax=Hydrocurvibacter mobilis TaxID=3131936 RepID=UPI0031FA19F3